MTDTGTKLLNEALELPPTERAELAEQLLSSLAWRLRRTR